jgi:negative regulator of flagellin synthesis FlgM
MKVYGGGDEGSRIHTFLQRIQRTGEVPNKGQLQVESTSPKGERVEISPQAREIQRLKAALEEIPDVRQKRVDEIRKLIQEGRYRVDLDAVSDRLLQALLLGEL